jgi:hypothetical protein
MKKAKSVSRDEMSCVPLGLTCKQVFQHISEADDVPPAVQVMAALVLANEICKAKQLDIREALIMADNLVAHGLSQDNTHVKALKRYITNRL